jgi:hypothetical protein
MTLPRDFLEELESELREARAAFAHDSLLVSTLEELCTLACAVARQLLRPVTVFDVIEAAGGAEERERRANLVRLVRSPDVGAGRPSGVETSRAIW